MILVVIQGCSIFQQEDPIFSLEKVDIKEILSIFWLRPWCYRSSVKSDIDFNFIDFMVPALRFLLTSS